MDLGESIVDSRIMVMKLKERGEEELTIEAEDFVNLLNDGSSKLSLNHGFSDGGLYKYSHSADYEGVKIITYTTCEINDI
jgi:hypothetical protein